MHYIADFSALVTFGTAVCLEEANSDFLRYTLFSIMVIFNLVFLTYFTFKIVQYIVKDKLQALKEKREKRKNYN